MAMKKKGAAKGGVRKMKSGSRISNAATSAAERARARRAANAKAKSPTDSQFTAQDKKQTAADRARTLANTRKEYAAMDASRNTNAAQRAAGTGHRTHGIKNPEYKDVSTQDYTDRPSLLKDKATSMRPKSRRVEQAPTTGSPNKRTGTANKVPKSGTSPKSAPKPDKNFGGKGVTKSLRPRLRPEEKKNGGAVTKKMGGGMMKKKGYAKGGAVAKKMGGGMMKKKGMAKGGKMAKMSKGGGTFARGSGAARPQRFRKNG